MYWNKAWKSWPSRSIRNWIGWLLTDSSSQLLSVVVKLSFTFISNCWDQRGNKFYKCFSNRARSAVGSASDSRARGPDSIPGPAWYFHFSFRWFKKGSCLRKYVHEVLVNCAGPGKVWLGNWPFRHDFSCLPWMLRTTQQNFWLPWLHQYI